MLPSSYAPLQAVFKQCDSCCKGRIQGTWSTCHAFPMGHPHSHAPPHSLPRTYDTVASGSQQTWDQAMAAARDNWEATKDKTKQVGGGWHDWTCTMVGSPRSSRPERHRDGEVLGCFHGGRVDCSALLAPLLMPSNLCRLQREQPSQQARACRKSNTCIAPGTLRRLMQAALPLQLGVIRI